MNVDLSKVDFAGIRAAAHRDRNAAMNRYLFKPVADALHRLARPEPRKPSSVFPSVRGC